MQGLKTMDRQHVAGWYYSIAVVWPGVGRSGGVTVMVMYNVLQTQKRAHAQPVNRAAA